AIDVAAATAEATVLALPTADERSPATLAALSAGGRVSVAADRTDRRTARVQDVAAGRELARLTGHAGQVLQVAISPDSRRAATAALRWGPTGFVRVEVFVWDAGGRRLAEFRPTAVLWQHPYGGLALSPDGARVAYDDYWADVGPDGRPRPVEARVTVRDV